MELRGVAARDLTGALKEMDALGAGLRTERTLYHASINTRADETMTPEQWLIAINRLEAKLGFTGQPRAIIEHRKEGREHVHIVWSRTDLDRMRAIPDSHNYRKHEEVARELEREFGHARVQGAHAERDGTPRPDRTPSHAEMQQAARNSLTPKEAKAHVTAIWQQTDNGQAFAAALFDTGWMLARGDRRDFVAVDPYGGVHSLARRVEGATAADIRTRLSDIDPAKVPPVAMARQAARDASTQTEKGRDMQPLDDVTLDRQPDAQRAKLDNMREMDARIQSWKQDQQRRADEATKDEERRRGENKDRQARTDDVTDAGDRYRKALGQHYDIKDPYGSLARAALSEWVDFRKEQNALKRDAAAEKDPEKRKLIEMHREIAACDYMAITSTRLAGMSETIAGRSDHPSAVQDRERAQAYRQRGQDLRAERDAALKEQQLKAEQQKETERTKGATQQQDRATSGAARTAEQQGRGAQDAAGNAAEAWASARSRIREQNTAEQELRSRQAEETKQREGLQPGQPTETAPQGKEARQMASREEAAAAWSAARASIKAPSNERSQGNQGGRSAERSGGRGGGMGR